MEKRVFIGFALLFFSFTISAQVLVRYEPRHKVALVNRWIRLLDVRIPPGDTSLFHIHEIPSYFIPLSTSVIGVEIKGQSPQESKFSIGANWYNAFENGPLIHRVWNIDTNVLHVIDLELLTTRNFSTVAQFELPNSKLDFENERLRVYKLELKPGQNLSLPFLNTPMLLISASGPELEIKNTEKVNSSSQLKPGSFQWFNPLEKFQLSNKGNSVINAVLILVK